MMHSHTVYSVGTPVGVQITNDVTVDYNISGLPGSITTSNSFFVNEIIEVDVSWQDASNLLVVSSSTEQALSFLITNIGNGIEVYSLAVDDNPAVADEFDPTNVDIYLDTNRNGFFDTGGVDIQYVPGVNDLSLDANGIDSQIVFVTGDIPVGLADDDESTIELSASSVTPGAAGAATGTTLTGVGDGGLDAIVGFSQAEEPDLGTYQVASLVDVNITKSAEVIDDTAGGGTCTTAPCTPLPGAIIQYTLEVSAAGGINSAENVVITDAIPTDTTYELSSITLDGTPLTDSDLDADAGFISANVVTVNLGDLNDSDTHTITFNVTIN